MGSVKFGQKKSFYANYIPVYLTHIYIYIPVGTNAIMGTCYLFFKECLIINYKLFLMIPVIIHAKLKFDTIFTSFQIL